MHFSPIKTVQLPTSVSARRATIADRHPRHHRRQRQQTTHGDRNRQTHQQPPQPDGDMPRRRPERVLFSATGAPAAGPDRAAEIGRLDSPSQRHYETKATRSSMPGADGNDPVAQRTGPARRKS